MIQLLSLLQRTSIKMGIRVITSTCIANQEELKTASERSSENCDWQKLLAKPASFDPSSRGAEISG